jgi:tetratricopeptide (TPR) repeat protein
LYADISEYELALENHLKAQPIFIELIGEISNEVADNYVSIGIDYKKIKKYDLALINYFKALEIFKVLFGEKHKKSCPILLKLLIIYVIQVIHQN